MLSPVLLNYIIIFLDVKLDIRSKCPVEQKALIFHACSTLTQVVPHIVPKATLPRSVGIACRRSILRRRRQRRLRMLLRMSGIMIVGIDNRLLRHVARVTGTLLGVLVSSRLRRRSLFLQLRLQLVKVLPRIAGLIP